MAGANGQGIAVVRHRVRPVDPCHRRSGSPRRILGVTGCKGRPNLHRNGDQAPAATVTPFPTVEPLGNAVRAASVIIRR